MEEGKTRPPGPPRNSGMWRIARLVVITCSAIAMGAAAMILIWLLFGDLETETVAAAVVLLVVLAGTVLLALRGRQRAALIVLSALMFLLVAADLYGFGLHSSMASAFLIPILLLGCGLGLRAGVAAALVCSAYGWLLAAAENAGWIALPYAADISHLTFDAPSLTVIYLIAAVIAGYGNDGLWKKESREGCPEGEES